jgi:UDP-3-O-[3-hydroxymyristoyl] glucosamine N-acyltransferase
VILGDDAPAAPCAMLRTPHPYLAFARALDLFTADEAPVAGCAPLGRGGAASAVLGDGVSVGPLAVIGEHVRLGARVVVHPHVVIGRGVQAGDDCVLHAHVSIRERCILGDRVILQNGAVIGSDGYGFVPTPEGHHKIPQRAIVVIEDDVEMGANTTIDRPAVGETRIRAGSKIDNLVQIAHGCASGATPCWRPRSASPAAPRSATDVVLAGQVGVAGHIGIGDRVRATAQTGIPNDVAAGAFVSGYPAIDNREWLKSSAVFRKLPELRRQVQDLAARLAALEEQLGRT